MINLTLSFGFLLCIYFKIFICFLSKLIFNFFKNTICFSLLKTNSCNNLYLIFYFKSVEPPKIEKKKKKKKELKHLVSGHMYQTILQPSKCNGP